MFIVTLPVEGYVILVELCVEDASGLGGRIKVLMHVSDQDSLPNVCEEDGSRICTVTIITREDFELHDRLWLSEHPVLLEPSVWDVERDWMLAPFALQFFDCCFGWNK